MPTTHYKESACLKATILRLSRHAWLPPELLHLATEVTRLQLAAAEDLSGAAPLPLPQDAIAAPEAHCQGKALLDTALFPYDAHAAARMWDALLRLSSDMEGPMGAAAQSVLASMKEEHGLNADAAFTACLSADERFFAQWEQRLPEAPAMARFLAQASLTPWLEAATRQLAQWHNASSVWEFGVCPHCGSLPFMGQLRGKEGARWHICSFCRLAYRVPRLQCPVCLEKDTAKLHFFTTQSEAGYEVHVCESCKNAIKLRDLREADSTDALPALDDLDSLPLDLVARQQGYSRSTMSAWGF